MIKLLFALLAGSTFGLGMAISGMTNPAHVLGFFDVAGDWDPTLAFVMAGAVSVMALAWAIRARMTRSLIGLPLPGPAATAIDARLIGGSLTFGLGWGIVGLCPGAVVPALGFGGWPVALFLAAMLAGMALARLATERLAAARA